MARFSGPLNRVGFVLVVFFLAGCSDLERFGYEQGLKFENWRAGLEERELSTPDGMVWFYLDSAPESGPGSTKPTLLLLHGFGADSSNWVRFAGNLVDEYRVIAPDIIGHGASTSNTSIDFHYKNQAERVGLFMDALGVQSYHVVGNSMGGGISVNLAVQRPDQVLTVALLNSAGITIDTRGYLELQKEGNNPLIVRQPENMFVTMDWASEDPPYMPDFFIRVMGEKKAANSAVAQKMWVDVKGDNNQQRVLEQLEQPVFILWGEEDRLLSLENIPVFQKLIPHAQLKTLDGIGHLPMVEAPRQSAAILSGFWKAKRG